MANAEFTVETDRRTQAVNVTDAVREALPAEADGVCTVFVRHTTAGVVVQEAESRLLGDVERAVEGLVPDDGWDHDEVDDNADSHLRATLLGEHVTLPVAGGDLDLGTWQSVVLFECGGPRRRTLTVVTH